MAPLEVRYGPFGRALTPLEGHYGPFRRHWKGTMAPWKGTSPFRRALTPVEGH